MRLLIPEGTFALDKPESLFWHRISDFSKWSYFFLIFSVVMFLRDWVFDGILLAAFGRDGEWMEFIETSVILIAASIFQVYHYHQEQAWMDANHKYLKTIDRYEKFRARTSSTSSARNGHSADVDDLNSSVSNVTETESDIPSQQNGNGQLTPAVDCCNNQSVWDSLRRVAKFTIFGLPVFRAVANWKDLKDKEKMLEARRANRRPVDFEEIDKAVTKSERDVSEQTFQVIEQYFETLPQSVVQVCLAARVNETLRLDSFTDGIRLILVIASLFMAAFSSTKYALDYCKHLKTIHFQDFVCFNHRTEFVIVDWKSTLILFFMHLCVIVSRFYGICYIFVVYGQIQGVIFVALIYLAQYTWLQLHPSCRLMYENPPRGITTNYSNIIDRWTNVFTFHMIKPTVRTISLFNMVFLVCTAVFTLTFGKISDTLMNAEISNDFFNYTNPHSVEANNETFSGPVTYYGAFSNLSWVLVAWLASAIICFVLSWPLESRMKPFLKTQFPLSKGFPFWERVMKCMHWEKVDPKFRRFVCLCVLASDEDFATVFNAFCCNIFCNMPKPRPDEEELENLWESIVSRTSSGIPLHFTTLETSWDLVKRDKVRNKYMVDLIELVDSAFRDGNVLPIHDLHAFLKLVKNFELHLCERNSLRLHRTEEFINELYKDYGSQFSGDWRAA